MAALTDSILHFVTESYRLSVPGKALDIAKVGFTDCLAVMMAGLKEPVAHVLRRAIAERGGKTESRLLLGTDKALAADAALIGATTAHALDFDDYAYSNHPSAVLVPAILAEAEVTGASGADMLRAYLIGYETWGAIMKREPDHLHSKGWHPTAIFGALGVVAALASLRKLDETATRNALGLAVAHGGGVMANFGTMAKPYQGGRASQAGVASIRLALAGMDAGAEAIDGAGGYLQALSPNGKVDLTSPADYLGKEWYITEHGLNIKGYPTVGASQRVIDAAIQLKKDHDVDAKNIDRIVVHISEKHIAVMNFHQPQTALEAKFSVQFAAVAGLVNGQLGFQEMSDAFVQRVDVQDLMARVELVIGPDDDPIYPVGARADKVGVRLKDGTMIESQEVERARGHGLNPMSQDDIKAKFMMCTERYLDPQLVTDLYECLQNFEQLGSIDELPIITM